MVLILSAIAVGLGLYSVLPGLTPQISMKDHNGSADLIDVAVSYLAFEYFRHFSYALGDESCSELVFQTPIPDHTVYDEKGNFHSALYMIDMSHTLMCRFGELNDYFEMQERAMEVLQGRSTTGTDGILLHADQQSVRVFAIHIAEQTLRTQIRLADAPKLNEPPTSHAEVCAKARDLLLHGASTELKYAAFKALIFNQIGAGEDSELSECFQWLADPDEALIEKIKDGEVDAALNLGYRELQAWIDHVRAYKESIQNQADAEQEENLASLNLNHAQAAKEEIEAASKDYPLYALTRTFASQHALAVVLRELVEGLPEAMNQVIDRYKKLEEAP